MDPNSHSITEQNYPEFKEAYNTAEKGKKESFMFEGQEIHTQYAKYVVEYMEGK